MTGWLSLLQMMFLTNNLFEAGGNQEPPEGFHYASYDVTIPRKLIPRFLQQENDVSYLIQIKGKNRVVHLRQQKGFVSKHFPIFTYSKKGELQVDYPFIRDDCYYRGFVQSVLLSSVTLSTCSEGLRGLLRLENETYEIEPILNSTTFQHLVYRLEEREGAAHMRCGVRDGRKNLQEIMIQTKHVEFKNAEETTWWTHTRYADVAIVVEHQRYIKFGSNETLVALRVLDIIHASNSAYEPLGVQVSIAALEIWSENNLITVSFDIDTTLENFRLWRKNNLVKRLRNDAAHLLAFKSFGVGGLAFSSTICDAHWAAGVAAYVSSSLSTILNIFTHELGHNLGMGHDRKYCFCGKPKCIMYPTVSDSDRFSNCSYQDYFKLKDRSCLLIPPEPERTYKLTQCGNKVVENGEQCDCGSETQCQLDQCCLSNCTLRSGATCAFGNCCRNCQYEATGSICRNNVSMCDLPEYCNGRSERCPDDFHVQDGTLCGDGAYCYHGTCNTHDKQCQTIFGSQARMAPDSCFKITNTHGDRFGNCGLRNGIYKKCEPHNVLCGRIQCQNVADLPSLVEHTTIIQSASARNQCWSTDYHSGMRIADLGAVRNGTPCGMGKICINRECKNVSLIQDYANCSTTLCHNRGVCNNYNHCHCDYGWAPPDCLREGYGGSSDSGPTVQGRELAVTGTVIIIGLVISAGGLASLGLYFKYVLRFRLGRIRAISPVETS